MSATVATSREDPSSPGGEPAPGPADFDGRALRALAWAIAWGLGVVTLWPPADLARSLEGASRVACVWTPWVALVGLPGGRAGARTWPLALGLALPLVALAGWVDHAGGAAWTRLEADLVCGVVLVALLGEAQHLAARGGVRAYGWIWLAVLAVLPTLAVALAWGDGARLEFDTLPGRLFLFSPLGTIGSMVRPMEAPAGLLAGLRQPGVSAAIGVLAITAWLGVRGRGRSA